MSTSGRYFARAVDFGLYFAAGRNDIDEVQRLLELRSSVAALPAGACPSSALFPEVVAPTHHNPKVADRLVALGCPRDILPQLVELASRPIGADVLGVGLPPRTEAGRTKR
jgi:hypothetical protein